MRFSITKTEVKLIAQELDVSRRLLHKLVAQKPWIAELSKLYLCDQEHLCGSFPVFRTVGLLHLAAGPDTPVPAHLRQQVAESSSFRSETVVSTSLNPDTALSIAAEQASNVYFTGGMFRGGLISTRPIILRYDVPLDRVILFVPALLNFLFTQYSQSELAKTRYRNRHGRLERATHVFRIVLQRQENEVIADVTGIEPTEMWYTDANKPRIWLARSALLPNFDPIQYMRDNHNWGEIVPPLPPPPGGMRRMYRIDPNTPTPSQLAELEEIRKFVPFVRRLFETPWQPGAGGQPVI